MNNNFIKNISDYHDDKRASIQLFLDSFYFNKEIDIKEEDQVKIGTCINSYSTHTLKVRNGAKAAICEPLLEHEKVICSKIFFKKTMLEDKKIVYFCAVGFQGQVVSILSCYY